MAELLKTILSLSLSGSLLILVLLLCKPFLKDRVSKRWQYYIWLIVIARLLLPFTPETSLVGTLFQHFDQPVNQVDTILNTFMDTNENSEPEHPSEPNETDTTARNREYIFLFICLIAAVGLLIRKVTVYQSFVKYIKVGQIEVSDMELWERVGKMIEQTGIKRSVGLYTNHLISSPLLIGFFRPCIMLPTVELSDSDFQYTVLHELTHYKRLDMFYKWLVQITICLHWFNPLVHLMGREINRDCEFSCDEAMIRSLDKDSRRAYGDTLLNAVETGGAYKNSVASITLHENAALLKERLDAIMKYEKKSKFMISITLAATVLFCAGATATGAYAAISPSDTTTSNPPWAAMGEAGQTFYYTQAGYYQGSFIFELGWNLNDKAYTAYSTITKLTLSDLTTVTVAFDESCKEESQNQAVLSDLTELISRLKDQTSSSAIPLEKPLVVSVSYVGDSELATLAEEYYADGELTRFSAIFSSLDKSVQKEYCSKMIEDGKTSFLSSTAGSMGTDLIDYCTEETYKEDRISLFSTLVPHLTDAQKQTWIARATKDHKNTFLAVLTR